MRQLLLLSVLLLGATWALAQSDQTSPTQTSPSQTTSTGAGSETSIQGCLSGSDGNFTLTDKNGNTFKLAGDTAKLTEHVGHEIQVTGSASSASSAGGGTSTDAMGQTTDSSQQAIQVTSVKHIAKTCKSAGTSH